MIKEIKKASRRVWKELTYAESDPKPLTQLSGGGTDGKNPFERLMFTDKKERKSGTEIYKEGGPVSDMCDAYPLYALTNGYEFQCEKGDEALKDKVIAWADQPHVNFDQIIWQGILDGGIVNKTAYQEIIPDKGQFNVWGVVPREAESFKPIYDEFGRIIRYEQHIDKGAGQVQIITIPPERMLTITLFPLPGEVEGISIIDRAYDNIMQFADIFESTTLYVHRHGHPKYHVAVGDEENHPSATDLKNIGKEFADLKANNEWVTGPDVAMTMIDTAGASGLDVYMNVTLQNLACAMGVPEEMAGLGRGSTEATANVRLKTFYDKIGTIQNIVARAYSRQLLDKITGKPGSVWIEFHDVSDEDIKSKAEWIAMLRNSSPDPDAIADAAWCREQLGIPPAEDVLPDIEENPLDKPLPNAAPIAEATEIK